MKDSRGDDKEDVRKILLTGFGRGDTHGTHSNLHYGLDNWMYGSVGYDGGQVTAGGESSIIFVRAIFASRPMARTSSR